jgi:hypothetical protein
MQNEARQVLAQILQHADCASISGLGMSYLEELLELYFNILAGQVMRYAEANNRTKPTWKDVVMGLQDIVPLDQVEAFCKQEIDMDHDPLPTPSREMEQPKDATVQSSALESQSFNEDPFGIIAAKRNAVPSHFPPFPPPHSYMQTKVH